MKKFKFTLQTVHNVREMRQEREQLVLMQMQSEIDQAAERIAQIEKIRFESIKNYTHRLRAGETINPVELELNSNHLASLDRQQREAEMVLQEKKQAYVNQSKRVATAVRDVKITKQLRETQQARHQLEMARQEQNALDEIVSANYARAMSQPK